MAAAAALSAVATAQNEAPPPSAPPGVAELTKPKFAPDVDPFTTVDMDKVSYILGRLQFGRGLSGTPFKLNLDAVKDGLSDAVANKSPKFSQAEIQDTMQKFQAAMEEVEARQEAKAKMFLTDNAKKPGVKTTASGLQYEVIKEGEGPKPAPTDVVSVVYVGTHVDGREFDSTKSHPGETTTSFGLNKVIPGWTEGVGLMSKGAKYRFYIPGSLAYGPSGNPQGGIGPDETLIFDIELVDFKPAAPEPPAK